MTPALVAAGAGAVVYLLVLAAMGYWAGEAPGGLARALGHLQGEGPPRRPLRWWVRDGRRRRELLTAQFGVALQAMAASLRAGASLRTAVERAPADLERMLAGQPQRPMVAELAQVVRDLQLGYTLEEALVRLRDRVNLEDVHDFVAAVLLCRVRGGNAATVMASIAGIIEDKIAVRRQILTLTAGKRMEGSLITCAPPVMVGFLWLTSPGYLAPLFGRLAGQILVLLGVAFLVAAYLIGRRILDIEV